MNPNYTSINVKEALADKNSIFYFYQKMLQYRKDNPALIYGDFQLLAAESEKVFAYKRWNENEEFCIILNFSEEKLVLSNFVNVDGFKLKKSNYSFRSIYLRSWEANIYKKIM